MLWVGADLCCPFLRAVFLFAHSVTPHIRGGKGLHIISLKNMFRIVEIRLKVFISNSILRIVKNEWHDPGHDPHVFQHVARLKVAQPT